MIEAAAKPQILLCRTGAERERAQQLFPSLEAIQPNGDLSMVAGRRVVAFGEQFAATALPIAAECKRVLGQIPEGDDNAARQWVKDNALPPEKWATVATVPAQQVAPPVSPPDEAIAPSPEGANGRQEATPPSPLPPPAALDPDGPDFPTPDPLGFPPEAFEPPPRV